MGKIAFDRRWVFCFWTLMFGCQRNMVIHVNNGWKLGLNSSTVANDGEQWWTTDKLWFDTFWYVFDTTVPAVVACLAAHSVGYKPSFRWSGQVLFSQHRVATQRVGGKDGRRLGVPKTEPKKKTCWQTKGALVIIPQHELQDKKQWTKSFWQLIITNSIEPSQHPSDARRRENNYFMGLFKLECFYQCGSKFYPLII